MKEIEKIRQYADSLRLTLLKNHPESLIHEAQIDNPGYLGFTLNLLEREIKQRQKTDLERRLTLARLPKDNDLAQYDFNHSNGISKPQLKELRELLWLDQNYNLILMGPSGTGKTYIASGLVHDAVKAGYKAYFKTMEELLTILRMKEMTGSAMNAYNRLLKANLIAIDDIMLFPMKKNEAVAFFNMVNHLHEKCSIIVTTNKSPKQWAETLDDEVLATALLDRLLYRCEVIKLDGNSYRMENRKSIFNQ
ncbi:IS21-like element helper ATPase IstB [Mangrovibacterium marinum]|uniref:DNA replication protein DnaC n=1 Tax=Mangrovibacterium marinum TaxID=1639118 RepID=A0A2T5BQ22_9BACT|nr:IS21-like element helper ATPase IstB [Mangrovibacterium marinum]PTN01209.1 DNA replication protein DnaC [Mangrovibacterium marinum]